MRLFDLLFEDSKAAEKAKKQGLKAGSFGKWLKGDKVVARSKGDDLIPVADKEDPTSNKAKTNLAKPTGTSAKAAGTAATNTVRPQDVEKQAGKSEPQSTDGQQPQGPPVVPPNPYKLNLEIGKPVDASDLHKVIDANRKCVVNLLEPVVIGEETIMVDREEWELFFRCGQESDDDLETAMFRADEDGERQDSEWRSTLSKTDYEDLLEAQFLWQNNNQYALPDGIRKGMNALFNKLTSGDTPATIYTENALERGMELNGDVFKDFIRDIRVGEKVEIPPSGFSSTPIIARTFARPVLSSKVGVLIRVAPKADGTMNGIRLHSVTPMPGNVKAKHFHEQCASFEYEKETILTNSANTVCRGVKRLIMDTGTSYQVSYILELECERDLPVTEGIDENAPNPVFEKIMNTSFGFWNKKRNSSKLGDIAKGVGN